MLQHMTQRKVLCLQSSSRFRACAKWNFSTLHHLFLAVNANSNPYTLASKGRLSPERHLRTCFGCDCLWATSIRASLLTFRDVYIFLHVFSRDTQEGKLLALCQLDPIGNGSSRTALLIAFYCIHIMLHMGPSPQVGFHQYAQQLKAKNARETSWKSHEQSEVSQSFLRLH